MSQFCVVILAAGEGKRMKSRVPKVMHPVCGKPMINHVVAAAKALAPKKIDVVIPVEDRRVVRYFLDNLIRKNSPVVRAAITVAHQALNLGLFPRLVPYHYLIFKGREAG